MTEATDEDIAAGKKTYRARCLDHGTEWRTLEPTACKDCVADSKMTSTSEEKTPVPVKVIYNPSKGEYVEAKAVVKPAEKTKK